MRVKGVREEEEMVNGSYKWTDGKYYSMRLERGGERWHLVM